MKILFSTGKGGVGKSTMAAAAAWQLSRNHRVLIISLDPAHNLGDIFGVALAGGRKQLSRNLHLREVNLPQLSREYLKREIDVLSASYKYLQTLNLDNYFSVLKYSPGIEEYALLTSIEETIRDEQDYDIIIFDTPPTGLTLRFLALPKVTITWIDRLIQIRQKILEKRHTIQKIRGNPEKGTEDSGIILNYDEDDDDVLRRLRSLKTNYETLTAVLEGKDCTIFVVFNPDLLSLRESQRLAEGLRELHLPLRLMINNKVTGDNEAMAEYVESTMKRSAGGITVVRVALHRELQSRDTSKLYEIDEDMATPLLTVMNN
jgi:arsenite-transporting ATPase